MTRWAFRGLLFSALCVAACDREERDFSLPPALGHTGTPVHATPAPESTESFLDNSYSIGQGQNLYVWFNCAGCHGFAGGGAMGPPLRDDKWLYGSSPEAVHRSIAQGRPRGMPAFAQHLPDSSLWQLTAYVLTLSGQLRLDVKPGRQDHISTGSPPSLQTAEPPPSKAKEGS